MDFLSLPRITWGTVIIPQLISGAIKEKKTNPIYILRQVCKHFNNLFKIGLCKQILHSMGVDEIILHHSVNQSVPAYVREISLIIELEKGIKKYNIEYALEKRNMSMLFWLTKSGKQIEDKGNNIAMNAIINDSSKANLDDLNWWIYAYTKLKNFGLQLRLFGYVVAYASCRGHLNVMNWWKDFCLKLDPCMKYSTSAIDEASMKGQIDMLNWWKDVFMELKDFGFTLIYTEQALDEISTIGGAGVTDRIVALNWWKNTYIELKEFGFTLKYSEIALDSASARADMDVLNWWKDFCSEYGLEIKYSQRAIDDASNNGHLGVIIWWEDLCLEFGLKMKYSRWAMDSASEHGHTHILDKWKETYLRLREKDSGSELDKWKEIYLKPDMDEFVLEYTKYAMDRALMNSDFNVLNWWKKFCSEYELEIKYSEMGLDFAMMSNCIDLLTWLKDSELEFRYTHLALDIASKYGHLHVLIWLVEYCFEHKLEIKYSKNAMDGASKNGHLHVLIWWKNNKYNLKPRYSTNAIYNASDNDKTYVIDWWNKSQLRFVNPPKPFKYMYNDREETFTWGIRRSSISDKMKKKN